jgi:hypothetical protein
MTDRILKLLLVVNLSTIIFFLLNPKKNKLNTTEKLYFEFRKKDSSVTADGFLRYKGKWFPIVICDTMAVIYQ